MSRFDLFFIVLDECDEVSDHHIAQHIVSVHAQGGGRARTVQHRANATLHKVCAMFQPIITAEAQQELVNATCGYAKAAVGTNRSSIALLYAKLEAMVRISKLGKITLSG